MTESCDGMETILNDVIDMQKAEDGKFVMLKEPFCLSNLLERIFRQNAPVISNRRTSFALKIDPGLVDEVFIGDRQRLGQVLTNLLSNARKFVVRPYATPSKYHLTRIVLQGRIVTSTEDDGNTVVEISVQDTGVGIPKGEVGHLFEAYRQLRAGQAQGKGGAGLGLSLSKHFVESHGGSVVAYSCPGVGSRFVVKIPFLPDTPAQSSSFLKKAGDDSDSDSKDGRTEFQGCVLVVDDLKR